MKHLQHHLAAIALLCAGACQNPDTGATTGTQTPPPANEQSSEQPKGPITFERHRIAHQKDTLTFDLAKPARVHIELKTPTESGNIRINQLFTPKGDADGPFGKMLDDSLTQIGTYRLIIGESLMQEDPYVGDYKVTIDVK